MSQFTYSSLVKFSLYLDQLNDHQSSIPIDKWNQYFNTSGEKSIITDHFFSLVSYEWYPVVDISTNEHRMQSSIMKRSSVIFFQAIISWHFTQETQLQVAFIQVDFKVEVIY